MFKSAWFYLSVGKKEKSFHEKTLKRIPNILLIVCVGFFFIVKNDFATHCLYTKKCHLLIRNELIYTYFMNTSSMANLFMFRS